MFKLKRDAGGFEGKNGEKRARRRAMGRRVVRVGGRVLAVAAVAGVVAANVAMAMMGDTVESYLGGDKIEVTSEEKDATMQAGAQLAQRIEGEGLVLLKNDDEALPLPEDCTQVNVFGWASTQWVASGSGSGQVSGQTTGLLDALSEAGVSYNTQLTDMYRGFCGERPYKSVGALSSRASEFCRLYEPSIYDKSCYSDELLSNARKYSDTALVVISRTAGESIDCPRAQYKVDSRGGVVDIDVTRSYLELSQEEEDLLRYVGKSYEHVVVLVNSTNAMELGELETTPGIDAALLVGCTGGEGSRAVVDALWGRTNPSGRTTDTYAFDFATAASWANSGAMGEGIYTNGQGLYPADGTMNANVGVSEPYDAVRFCDYAEGIYVGYRWYETADAEGSWDGVSNQYGQGYDGVVQYPFGYGLSYTSFKWEVTGRSPGQGTTVGRKTDFSIRVKVTNTGKVAGRDVVQLYCTPPYTKGGIEKSAAVLVAYEKTRLLKPGETQEISLSFSMDDVASYDYSDADGDGFAGYELERGEYMVELRRDAHTVADCEFASTMLWIPRTIQCPDDIKTGAAVQNRFTGDSAWDGVSIDGSNSGANITWLSRADFAGTFPRRGDADREMADNVAALNLYADGRALWESVGAAAEDDGASRVKTEYPLTTTSSDSHLLSEGGELTELGRQLGLNYSDEAWDDLLDQVSIADMERIVLHGYISTGKIDGIGKPRTKEVDGPSQVGSFNQLSTGVAYPGATVLAQTWSKELAREYGRQVGLECASIGVDGWYAPSVNVHRTPLGGRNYEYYSEDPLVSGAMAAQVVAGSKEAGTYCFVKHLVANGQDTYRDSLYEWMTEQTLREVYLPAFRMLARSGATGIMTSYNRLGATWAGGNAGLLTDVLRGEWGFAGCVITDYADHHVYMNADQMLRAGGDLFMDGVFRNGAFEFGYTQGELSSAVAAGGLEAADAATFASNLRRATKDVLYTWLNARATNLAYNQEAALDGSAQLVRPVKVPGVQYVSVALAWADLVCAVAVIRWAHRTWLRHRSRQVGAGEKNPER
ncbi:glycoside hydrolase family 3 protein [Paratractidigestivibacter faecalis]|uniref:glycoside hydrolase family 3 protein n=1 Tax=Paratractidigestivibacter faecalis TaxID=2292441 RepID=UPI003AB65461